MFLLSYKGVVTIYYKKTKYNVKHAVGIINSVVSSFL